MIDNDQTLAQFLDIAKVMRREDDCCLFDLIDFFDKFTKREFT